jgi:class 3 adenylate cyclase
MNCPNCSSQIPESSKFCPECGSPLSLTSPSFPTEADRTTLLQKYIPPELAKRILSAGKQIESERRLVTVLFADVSGFTAMSEKLDPEEVSSVLNDCFKGLISIVYKYEGVIDKFIGDEIMAIFGAPLTHENDPERSVRCSMEMMEYMERFNQLSPVALPEPLGLHISMNTGMVVAGNVGSDLRMNYSVIGDTVNLASKLKHVAERGEIVVSEDTFRIVSSLVNAEEPRLVEIKGKSEPAKVYKILSIKGDIEPGTRVSQKNPIIGREQEIAVFQSALEKVLQKKEQRVFIRGEAGVGKTRLKLELIQHAKSSGITTYEGKCSSFEINTPYYLWTTLLKDILQLKSDTGETETRKRLHDILQILSLEKHEPYLATLLSLRYEEILLEEDQERKRRIYESLKEFLQALAQRKPSLFLLEDVHWIDRFSQDLLIFLFTEQALAQAMFVPIFRDEYIHAKELISHGGELIDLNRLSQNDAVRLICARLQVDEVPSNLSDLIFKRSEGNPFFIEELIKTLLDKNIAAVKKKKLEILQKDFENILPATVQGVIMARIDRLEERLKEVLFGASVIGREFDKSLLNEMLKKKETIDPSLHELLSLELILEKEEAKELAYLFKHYLIQEVAYNTILQKKRKELHKLIAQAIEKVYAGKLNDFYEILSFHYEKAEEWEKAAEYLSRAGRKVGEIFSKEESNSFAERKEVAIQKLYESQSAKSKGWNIVSVITMIVAIPTVLFMFAAPVIIFFLDPDRPQFIGYSLVAKWLIIAGATILYEWYGLFFIFLLVIPNLRKKPKIFDLMDDQIRVRFKNGSLFVIPFADIKRFRFYDPVVSKKRPLVFRIFDFRYLEDDLSVTFFQLLKRKLKRGFPYSFGFSSKKGGIYVERIGGVSFLLQSVLPWLNVPAKAKLIALTPTNPGEFFDQLKIAYEKWKRRKRNLP